MATAKHNPRPLHDKSLDGGVHIGIMHLTEPNFSNPAVFVPAFKHAVQPGHFVKVINSGVTLIGQLIGTLMHHIKKQQ
jgi:hypothetical protein